MVEAKRITAAFLRQKELPLDPRVVATAVATQFGIPERHPSIEEASDPIELAHMILNDLASDIWAHSPQEIKVLTPAELLSVVLFYVASGEESLKFKNTARVVNPYRVGPPVVHQAPNVDEIRYHNHPRIMETYSPGSIAMKKAFRNVQLPKPETTGKKMHLNVERRLRRMAMIKMILETQREKKAAGRPIEVNVLGKYVHSLANDVLITRRYPDGTLENLHKPEGINTKQDLFEYYMLHYGPHAPYELIDHINKSAHACYELSTDIGVVTVKEMSSVQRTLRESEIAALVFGVNDTRVTEEDKTRFTEVVNNYTQLGKKADLRGYTLEEGLPLETALKVNGGWVNDIALADIFTLSIGGIPRFEKEKYVKASEDLRDLVRVGGGGIASLLRKVNWLLSGLEQRSLIIEPDRHLTAAAQAAAQTLALEEKEKGREVEASDFFEGTWYDLSHPIGVTVSDSMLRSKKYATELQKHIGLPT